MDAEMLELYRGFVRERHRIWEQRQVWGSWETTDPILGSRKFTNVFRILDAGTQFLVKELLYADEPDYGTALMRCFLYRYINRPEPFTYFKAAVGSMPTLEDVDLGILAHVLYQYRAEGNPVFGTAFKMFSGAENKGTDRLTWVLELVDRYFTEGSPDEKVTEFAAAGNQGSRLNVLKSIPRCADFMGMQILTDFGYSPWGADAYGYDRENDFIVPGPGAIRGAQALCPGVRFRSGDVIVIIEELTRQWARSGSVRLAGRSPSLMDVQNTLCEFSKYVRYRGLPIPETQYRPAHPGPQEAPFLPPHWGI